MEAIINFWIYSKALLTVKLGFISNVFDRRMTQRSITSIHESQFYSNGLNEDDESDRPPINKLNAIPKPGFYLTRTDAAINGCFLGPINMDMNLDDGPGFYY